MSLEKCDFPNCEDKSKVTWLIEKERYCIKHANIKFGYSEVEKLT